MNNNRGFEGRRDDNSQHDDRDLERQMQRERTMQGGMGRGWNEPHERAGYGGDDRYGGNLRRDLGEDRGGYEREHDMRSHNFGFGGTDQGFRGGGYGGYGSDNRGYGNDNRGYGNDNRGYGGMERDRYGMGGYGNDNRGYGMERGRWEQQNQGRWGDERHAQDRGHGWGHDMNRGGYGDERGGGMGGGRFGSDMGSYGREGGAWGGSYGGAQSINRNFENRGGYGRSVGMSDMGWEQRNYGEGMRRGKAPKSYQRSDERIKEDICDRLMHGWVDAENVDVRVTAGEVTLTGTVEDRQSKRAIEDLAEQVMGVREVQNQIRVQQERQATTQPQTTSAATTGATAASKKPTA